MPTKAYRDEHRLIGLCTACSKEAEPGRKLCTKHKLVHRKDAIKCAKKRKRLGICVSCIEKAVPGFTKCKKHLEQSRVYIRKYALDNNSNAHYRAIYRDTGRCTRCSALLDEDADQGCVTCVNCRDENTKNQVTMAKEIMKLNDPID